VVEVTKDWPWFIENVYYAGRITYKREEISGQKYRVRVLAGNIAFDDVVSVTRWQEELAPWLKDNRAGEIHTSVVREVFFA
jgi:hypothetical protein